MAGIVILLGSATEDGLDDPIRLTLGQVAPNELLGEGGVKLRLLVFKDFDDVGKLDAPGSILGFALGDDFLVSFNPGLALGFALGLFFSGATIADLLRVDTDALGAGASDELLFTIGVVADDDMMSDCHAAVSALTSAHVPRDGAHGSGICFGICFLKRAAGEREEANDL